MRSGKPALAAHPSYRTAPEAPRSRRHRAGDRGPDRTEGRRVMKRICMVVIAAVAFSALGVSFAAAVGTPEVDRANATFVLDPIGTFKKVNCLGEDGIKYRTLRGRWEGGETEVTPGFTDYDLSGPLTVSNVVWTINLTTVRGVLRANILLRDQVSLIR